MSSTKMLTIGAGLAHPCADKQGQQMDMNEILAFVSAHKETAVAVLSALVALCGAFFASRETRKQRGLMEETLRQRLDGASIRWGDEAIEALAAAESLEHHDIHADIKAGRILAAQRLSALADRGRLFFPNHVGTDKSALKEAAYVGSRPPILDALVLAHFELISLKEGDKVDIEFLRRCRRLVVSELQDHLDPRHWDSVIERGATKKPQDHTDAQRRASTLKAELTSRRIDFFEKRDHP